MRSLPHLCRIAVWMFFTLCLLAIVFHATDVLADIPLGDDATASILTHPLSSEGNAYEINPGPDGAMWISDNLAGEIRRYAPDGSALTIFGGLGEVSDARADAEGRVWFVEQDTSRLGRLDSVTGQVVFWPLPAETVSAFGTALDDQGRVWVSDFSRPALYRLDPAASLLCAVDTSALANGGGPYLFYEGAALWFADFFGNAVLRLDVQTGALTRWQYYSIGWDFEAEGLSGDGAGGLWFADSSQNSLVRLDRTAPESPRLARYRLPTGYGLPAMLDRQGPLVWFSSAYPAVGVLDPTIAISVSYVPEVSQATVVPACEPAAASDPQTLPISNTVPIWGASASEIQEPAAGWSLVSLEEGAYPWGVAYRDGVVWAVDSGRQEVLRVVTGVQLTACKLADGDGSLATTDDQTPVEGWTIYLRVDGVRQEAGQLTGADGCTHWGDLEPDVRYAVEEDMIVGWRALTALNYDFWVAAPGQALSYTFVNSQAGARVYLPLIVRNR